MSPAPNNVLWAFVGGSLLYRSTDRGTTWQQRPMPPGNFPYPEFSFIDAQEGWFATGGVPATQCGEAGTSVWHTSDGGSTWQEVASVDWQHEVPGGIGIRQCKQGLSFLDATHGFLGASDPNTQPTIYRTADGGNTWAQSTLPDPPGFVTLGGGDTLSPGDVRGFGKMLLLSALGMQPNTQVETQYIFRSVDEGATWTYAATGGDRIDYATFVTESRWLKLSNSGSGFETTDAGKSWHTYPSGYQNAAGVQSSFVFADHQVGYATVRGGIQRTVDGGLHWSSIKTPGT